MAVRNSNEIIEMIKNRVGDDVSDEALQIIEDVTDTLGDMDRRIAESGDWERKYTENDANWRQRYRERFENAPTVAEPTDTVEFIPGEAEVVVEDNDEPTTYEELFTTE